MVEAAPQRHRGYQLLAWSVLVFNVLVILGGTVVRATGSGDGCGATWPQCQDQLIPTSPGTETVIEFTHRLMSGAAIIGVLLLVVFAFVVYPRRHRVRLAAVGAGVFLVIEALLGASLVVFGWVDQDASLGRVLVVPLHLMNTYILLGWLAVVAWWASAMPGPNPASRAANGRRLAVIGGLLLLIGVFGAWNALADVLFPAESIAEGVAAELESTAPFLQRIRVLHPVVAIVAGLIVAKMVFSIADAATGMTRKLGFAVAGLVFFQFFVGVTNLVLLTPVETQVIHLAVADLMWILFVFFGASLIGEPAVEDQRVEQST